MAPEMMRTYSITPDRRRVDCLTCDRMIAAVSTPLTDEQITSAVEWHADECGDSPQEVTYQEALLEGADPYEPDYDPR